MKNAEARPASCAAQPDKGQLMLSTVEEKKSRVLPALSKDDPAHRISPTRQAADWLLERIQKGRKEPFSEIVTLTPEIAEILLANNPDNRLIKSRQLDTFAADIEDGKWDLNGETIIVSKDGSLNDGQHRCLAVVKANKPIRTAIMFGVNRESRYTLDMGSVRLTADFLKMEGAHNVNHAAAIAKNLNLHRRGFSAWNAGSNIVSKVMVRQEFWNNEKEIMFALSACDGKFSKRIGLSALSTAYVLIARRNPAECAVFFQRLADGVGLRRGDQILALRNRFLQDNFAQTKGFRAQHKVEMIVKYWNAWRRGSTIQNLRITGSIPTIEK